MSTNENTEKIEKIHGVAGGMRCTCSPKLFATVTTLANHLAKNGVKF